MANKCIVCGKVAKDKRGKFTKVALIDDKFCSKPCSKKVKRMCKRIGCTETWYATVNNGQRYCSRDCNPQCSSGPKYPYKLSRQCTHCAERFSVEINDESDKLNEPICNECDAVLNSRDWKCMRLITEKDYLISDLKRLDDATIDFFYEECEWEYKIPKPIPKLVHLSYVTLTSTGPKGIIFTKKPRPRYSAKMQKYLDGLTDAERRKFLGEEE